MTNEWMIDIEKEFLRYKNLLYSDQYGNFGFHDKSGFASSSGNNLRGFRSYFNEICSGFLHSIPNSIELTAV